jgi:hypothetical protein
VNQLEDIRVVCEYPDVLPEEMPGMPPGKSGMLEAEFPNLSLSLSESQGEVPVRGVDL